METRVLGRTGFKVSALGFGAAPVGFLDTDRREVTQILNTLLDKGVNLIDTAAAYPGSEEAIGAAVAHRRDEYVLVSKCGQAFDDLEGEEWSPTVISQTVDRALSRLGTDHLDVMLLHTCDMDVLRQGDALGALVEARDAGKVRFVGYSGDNETAAYAAELDDVAVIETSVSICDQANIDMVLPKTRANDIGVLAKRPVANAAWRDLSEQRGMYTNYAKTYTERLAKMGITPADLGFSGDAAQVWPEIALRFTISQPGVTTAIVGTTRLESVERNLDALSKGALPETAIAELRAAFVRAETADGVPWPGQR
jgi:aryl-alcohol dehydrogenase-like predicted oxidoreductase